MSVFARAVNSTTTEYTAKDPKPFLKLFGESTSGKAVNEESAMTLSAYFDGVNLLANHIASLPFSVILRDGTGNIDHIVDHQLRELLQFEPNGKMTAFTFKKLMTVWMLNWGNAFALIKRDRNKITSLIPKKPWETKILRDKETGEIFYKFKDDKHNHPARDVLHLFQYSLDGIKGLSIIEAGAKDRFGGHLATEEYGEKFFKNDAHISGILKTSDHLGSDPNTINSAKSEVREEFDQVYDGRFHNLAILEGNWDYENVTLKASDAQLIERMKISVADIARWLHIPVGKLKQTDGESFNSREAQSIEYTQDALNPRIEIWQQECRRKLLLEREKRSGHEIQINSKDLMRSNLRDLGDFLSQMVDRSIFTPNQALKFVGEDTFEDGDIHLMQRNMQVLEERNDNQDN